MERWEISNIRSYIWGPGSKNSYAVFLDNYYKQQWNFDTNPWQVQMWGDWIGGT